MDFLRSIIGASTNDVRRLAVPVQVEGVTLHVLHPLLCLDSRLANIAVLPVKREGNGPMQAQWAINIVTAYLKNLIVQQKWRLAIKSCHHVREAAEYKHGPFCFHKIGIDPLSAVTPEIVTGIGGQFATEDWPRVLDRLSRKRQKRHC